MKTMHGAVLLTLAIATGISTIGHAQVAAGEARRAPATAAGGFQWVRTLKGPISGESGDDMVLDAKGNIFIAGHHGGLDLDDDGKVDLAAGGIDPLFLKLEPDGDISWLRSATGPGFDSFTRIAADHAGGAYVVGSFRETLTFRQGLSLRSAGENDGYLARYDDAGNVLWARRIGGSGPDTFRDVSSDVAGNAYVLGWSRGSFTLDGNATPFQPLGESAAIIASYDSGGGLRWLRSGTAAASWGVNRVEVGPAGGVFVAGTFGEGGVDFDADGRVDIPGRRSPSMYIARFDSAGGFERAWSIMSEVEPVNVTAIAFAHDGDVMVAGSLAAPADFDGDGVPDAKVSGDGETSTFLARYGRDGALRWVRSYALDGAWHVTAGRGRFVLSGFYRGARDIDEDGAMERHHSGGERDSDAAILVVSAEGRPERVWTASGPGNDQARAAVFPPGQSILYVTGFLQVAADFTGEGEYEEGSIRCDALGDLFIARYDLGEAAAERASGP